MEIRKASLRNDGIQIDRYISIENNYINIKYRYI